MKTSFPSIVAIIGITLALKLPDNLKFLVCSKDDPNFETCIVDGLDKARLILIQGVEELSIPPIDPLTIPSITIDTAIKEYNVEVNAILTNFIVRGLGDYVIDKLTVNPETFFSSVSLSPSGEIQFSFPQVYVETDYDMKGRMLYLPQNREGFLTGNISGLEIDVRTALSKFVEEGKEYWRIDRINIRSDIQNGVVNMVEKNLMMRSSASMMTNLFNERPRSIFNSFEPTLSKYVEEYIKQMGNKLLSGIPADELFIE